MDERRHLAAIITSGEEWLIERVIVYAKEHGYTKYTSTLKEAWRISVSGLSECILLALDRSEQIPQIGSDDDFAANPVAGFGIVEARRHRERGIKLGMFLGLMKYYRQAYFDLVAEKSPDHAARKFCHLFIERVFDLIELGFCVEWCSQGENAKLAELQSANRSLANEKNRFLTMLESLRDPVLLLDDTDRVVHYNLAAAELVGGWSTPGGHYYSPKDDVDALQNFLAAIHSDKVKLEEGVDQETAVDLNGTKRHFQVTIKRMLDVSGKFKGKVILLRDVTERKNHEQELNDACRLAKAASEAKSRFLANISHELRTPMTGVLGMLDIIAFSDDRGQQQRHLELAKSSAQSLLGLLDNLLDIAKIEEGVLNLELEPFNLRSALEEHFLALSVRASLKGLYLTWAMDPGVPAWASGDRNRIRQIMENLVHNAIKFTRRGKITISVQSHPCAADHVRLSVRVQDTGIGISPDKQKQIFSRFRQADESINRRYGGSGLGLSIAASLIQMMDGEIELTSIPGEGTTFEFSLKLKIAPAAETSPSTLESALLTGESSRRLRVLVADDDPVSRLVVRKMLEKLEHRVDTAKDGAAALGLVRQHPYDVVFLDIQMPVIDGLDAVREIRSMDQRKGLRTPVIATSAHSMKGDRERFLAAGMDWVITKPLKLSDLSLAITKVMTKLP